MKSKTLTTATPNKTSIGRKPPTQSSTLSTRLRAPMWQAVTTILFPYFDVFPNSKELTVTLITEKGQKAFEVNREHAFIDIRGMI